MKSVNVSKYSLSKVVVITLLLLITACSSTSGPVVIRESSPPVVTQQDEGKLGSDSENKQAMVQPVSPDKPINVIPVVEKLIAQSNREISNKNYDQAINLAERGLRINRKEPRLYLALAKAHQGEGNRQQSVYFARQGLRYAQKASDVHRELNRFSK